MARMEIIARTERRRRYSEDEKAALLAEVETAGCTVAEFARRHGMAERLLYNWRANRRTQVAVASEPMQFIPYGEVTDTGADLPAIPDTPVARSAPAKPPLDDLVRPHPGARPGMIDIDLTTGVRLTVDSYINEKALARVLRALRETSC